MRRQYRDIESAQSYVVGLQPVFGCGRIGQHAPRVAARALRYRARGAGAPIARLLQHDLDIGARGSHRGLDAVAAGRGLAGAVVVSSVARPDISASLYATAAASRGTSGAATARRPRELERVGLAARTRGHRGGSPQWRRVVSASPRRSVQAFGLLGERASRSDERRELRARALAVARRPSRRLA